MCCVRRTAVYSVLVITLPIIAASPAQKKSEWRSVVYGDVDNERGILTLRANGVLGVRAGKERQFEFLRLWRFDHKTERWSKVELYPSKPVVIRCKKRQIYSRNSDQELLALTREIALFWAEWKEDGRLVNDLLFCGPVLCNDIELGPAPEGRIATCVPFATSARAQFVPDSKLYCRE